LIAGLTAVGVTELARRWPRGGALLLTLPLVSILAFVMAWTKDRDLSAASFHPLALAGRLGLSFGTSSVSPNRRAAGG
jgi:hypothetical protein